jgi:hypothetical protein
MFRGPLTLYAPGTVQTADEAWVKALAAQRAAKRAEAQADQTGLPEDIKVATELAATAMHEKTASETAMATALSSRTLSACAETATQSLRYQAVMQGDARHFEEACKKDQEILKRLDATLLTAQAFPPTLISTPLQAGMPLLGYAPEQPDGGRHTLHICTSVVNIACALSLSLSLSRATKMRHAD